MARNLPFIRKMRGAKTKWVSVSWDNPNQRGSISKIGQKFDYWTDITKFRFRK